MKQASTGPSQNSTPPENKLPAPRGETIDPLDPGLLNRLNEGVQGEVIQHYFRAELVNEEHIPSEGPTILAANHSGNALPHDGIVLNTLLYHRSIRKNEGIIRSLFSPKLTKTWWMRAFTMDNFWRRCGGLDQTFRNFDHLLRHNHRMIYYPEGIPGIGKGFNRRYQLQYFYSSFVIVAARHNATVTPVNIVNAEWINPANITFKFLDRLADKLLGLPFFPIPNVFFTVLFPFIFYLGFPSRMVFKFGEPINIRELLEEEGCPDPSKPDRHSANRVAAKVRKLMQPQLDEAVRIYGQKPYDLSSLRKHFRENKGKRKRLLPSGWPWAFLRTHRDLYRSQPRNRLHKVLRDWDLIFFYLPLGWLGISLCRRLRKYPCGYRGMSSYEKAKIQGDYAWSLKENPLPESKTSVKNEEPQAEVSDSI